jgi:hypothetical protein
MASEAIDVTYLLFGDLALEEASPEMLLYKWGCSTKQWDVGEQHASSGKRSGCPFRWERAGERQFCRDRAVQHGRYISYLLHDPSRNEPDRDRAMKRIPSAIPGRRHGRRQDGRKVTSLRVPTAPTSRDAQRSYRQNPYYQEGERMS